MSPSTCHNEDIATIQTASSQPENGFSMPNKTDSALMTTSSDGNVTHSGDSQSCSTEQLPNSEAYVSHSEQSQDSVPLDISLQTNTRRGSTLISPDERSSILRMSFALGVLDLGPIEEERRSERLEDLLNGQIHHRNKKPFIIRMFTGDKRQISSIFTEEELTKYDRSGMTEEVKQYKDVVTRIEGAWEGAESQSRG